MATDRIAMMPVTDWLAICKAITNAVGEPFALRTGDVPDLLRQLANGHTYRDWEEG